MWNRIISFYHYAGVSREQYQKITSSLWEENRSILITTSGVTIFIFLGLIAVACNSSTMRCRGCLYGVGLLIELGLHVASLFAAEGRPRMIKGLCHIYLALVYVVSFIMDSVTRTDQGAVAFVVMLIICQLIFNEQPAMTIGLAFIMSVLYLVLVMHTKAGTIALTEDLVNVPAYWLAGMILNLLLTATRVRTHLGMQEQKQQKETLKEALDAADVAARSKETFLFNMSHDIRTPMNAIMGYTDLLEKSDNLTEKQHEQLEKIRMSSEYLLDLLDNVLEMSRMGNGKVSLEESPNSVQGFNDSLVVVFEEEMRRRHLDFHRTVKVENPWVYCDEVKLREIFLNILSNSVKYTPPGGSITMDLEEIPGDREGYGCFRTVIRDTGIGMSKEFLPHIFESFSRERSATESRVAGSGLGMGIVKNLVDMMGGRIEVESELGRGTTTTVWLPHRIVAPEDIPGREMMPEKENEAKETNLAGRRILLAEDNDLNAEIAMEILQEYGLHVDRAEDGVVCVDRIAKAESGFYDMILMDIQMPNMDGYKASRIIRKLADPMKSAIPIVAMTANAFEKDRQDAINAGMNAHLAKPIDISSLFAVIERYTGEPKDRSEHVGEELLRNEYLVAEGLVG